MSLRHTREDRERAYVDYVTARQPALRRFAYALCGDWHRADDLLQTALTKLYVAWPRVQREDNLDGYVRTILVRSNIDQHRRAWRRERPGLEGVEVPVESGERAAEDRGMLVEALLELPEMQRKCVLLRHWLGLDVRETATELGISEGTVKSHTSRGVQRLQSLLPALRP